MIALTTRLNERDEAIIQMQEELDAYDNIHKDSEIATGALRSRVQQLEGFIQDNDMKLPAEIQRVQTKQDKQDDDRVKLDDIETFNITYNNLLSPEEKILRLAEIADLRKNKIVELKETIEQMSNPDISQELNSAIQQNRILREEANSYKSELMSILSNQATTNISMSNSQRKVIHSPFRQLSFQGRRRKLRG